MLRDSLHRVTRTARTRLSIGAVASAFFLALAHPALARAQSKPQGAEGELVHRERQAQPGAQKAHLDQPGPPEAHSRTLTHGKLAIMAHIGLGTPYGGLGAALDFVPHENLGIEAGLGTNLIGPQFALTPRLRLSLRRQRYFTIGTGASTGKFEARNGMDGLLGAMRIMESMGHSSHSTKRWSRAYFWNFELGLETRSARSIFVTRLYLGYSRVLNPRDSTCVSPSADALPCRDDQGNALVYGGFALGIML
jgi:hypothetical protein